MLTRIISGIVVFLLLIPCIVFSDIIVLDIIMSVLCLMACYEMLGCIKLRKVYHISIPTLLISVLLPFSVRVIKHGMELSELIIVVFVVYLFYILACAVFSHGKHSPLDVSTAFVMIFYIIFGFMSVVAIRSLENGEYLFLLIFIAAWVSDTCAYFTGMFLGKHKLIPDVSPKKTVEGAIGGLVCCVIGFLLYAFVLKRFFDCTPNFIIFGLIGLFLSVISMCGDLIASLVKRHYDIKDYGNLIPGHGGIMDRFDSIIAVSSVLFVLLNIPFIAQNIL